MDTNVINLIEELARTNDSKYSDDEWNQKLLDASEKTGLSVEDILGEIEKINENDEFFEEEAEKEYWDKN